MLPFHAAILPFNGERTGIPHVIEGSDDLLKLDFAAPDGTEIPVTPRIAEVQMSAKHTG